MEIDPLHWTASIEVIGIIVALALVIVLICIVCVCWCQKSRYRQAQRLQRRNSIRQSMRSLNSIDPQGSLRRRNYVSSDL